jgi:hypothetical protein
MPVRQPTAKLRRNRRKGPPQAPETKVRGIKTEAGWEKAMKASDRRYVVVHVLSVRFSVLLYVPCLSQESATACCKVDMQFTRTDTVLFTFTYYSRGCVYTGAQVHSSSQLQSAFLADVIRKDEQPLNIR